MVFGPEAAASAWRTLAGAPADGRVQVVVDARSWLAPKGWVGIVAIDNVITASVPTAELRTAVHGILAELAGDEATDAGTVVHRLSSQSTLGPAHLFYPPEGFAAGDGTEEGVALQRISSLIAAADAGDLNERGIDQIESEAFVSRSADGAVAAACGYRRWPNGVAHLSVLTDRSHRRSRHGHRAAAIAVRHAIGEGLLPQWRARPAASQALATSLGLVRMGAQLSLQPASPH